MPREPERKIPCRCGSGKSYFACCLKRDRARAELRGAATEGHALVDGALAEVLPRVEAQASIACRAGCNACCNSFVRATLSEAELIVQFLVENPDVRARFEARLPSWRAACGPELETLKDLVSRHLGSPRQGPDVARYIEATAAHQRRRALCPFNDDDGRCAIYPVRPLPCRVNYVVTTADYCKPDQGRGPDVVRTQELGAAIAAARAAIHRGGGGMEGALPEMVATVIAGR